MRLRMVFCFLMAFTSIVNAQTGPQADFYLSTCVGSYCGAGGQQVDSPLYSTGNDELDRERWQAYRYEMTTQYEQAVETLKQSAENWALQKQQAEGLSQEQYQALKKQAMEALELSMPALPQDLPTLSERRSQNPYPSASAQKELDAKLDAIWKNIQTATPIDVAKSLQDELKSYIATPQTSTAVSGEFASRHEFLSNELILSRVIDYQGLLNVLYADKPDIRLLTRPQTEAGHRIRSDMNRVLANQSMVHAKCMQLGADVDACARIQEIHDSTKMAIYALDRWASEITQGTMDPQLDYLITGLEMQLGWTEGFVIGGVDTVVGIATMVMHPKDTANALGAALWNYDKTFEAIVKGGTTYWNEFVAADAEGKAAVIGRIHFEVLSALVPASKVVWLEKATKTAPLITNITRQSLEVMYAAQKVGVKNLDELVGVMRLNREMMINSSGHMDFVNGALGQLKPTEFRSYLAVVDEMGEALTPQAHNYLAKQVGYSSAIGNGVELSANKLRSMADSYLDVEKAINLLPEGIHINENMHRAVFKAYNVKGDDIFNLHRNNFLANHRLTPPGEMALYSVLGEESAAKIAAGLETGTQIADQAKLLEFASKKVEMSHILDLTDKNVQTLLKISKEQLIEKNYELTHQIGHAAQNKFNGIKTPSSVMVDNPDISNLVIFGKALK